MIIVPRRQRGRAAGGLEAPAALPWAVTRRLSALAVPQTRTTGRAAIIMMTTDSENFDGIAGRESESAAAGESRAGAGNHRASARTGAKLNHCPGQCHTSGNPYPFTNPPFYVISHGYDIMMDM